MRPLPPARPFALAVVSALLVLTGAASAQTPQVLVGDVPCIPSEGHGLVQAIAGPVPAGGEVRVYFRRQGHGDFYWLPATMEGSTYWAVLPVPEPDNVLAEIYGAVYGAAGVPLAQSRIQTVPVTQDCRVDLDAEQSSSTTHMTVGETALGQKLRKLAWWRCEGIRERIDVMGEERVDEACLPLAWWERPGVIAGLALVPPGLTVVVQDPPGPAVDPRGNPPVSEAFP
jgi:hypothetical protein